MGCYKKYKNKKKEDNFPAELAEMKVPKGSEWKEVKKDKINIPYIFKDTEWRF